MISRFEEEIDIKIFDRKKKPVEITREGAAIIRRLKVITKEIDHLNELTKEIKGTVKGTLSMAVIPTIAPFLLPLFLQDFARRFPGLNITVKEQTTGEIMRLLKSRELDIGIISIPVNDTDIEEIKLYDEPFLFYDTAIRNTQVVQSRKLDVSSLCLLEEGHCMRTQVINLCNLHKMNLNNTLNFDYKAGSIDSLLRFVKANKATTLLPYLSTIDLSDADKEHVSSFQQPIPFRTIGVAVHRHFVKKKVLEELRMAILEKVSPLLPQLKLEGSELSPV